MGAPGDAKTILIVDDDDDMAFVLTRVLERAGYQTRRAASGDEGVLAARQQPPDLILLDFMMPGKNGFEACREMRDIPALQDVPIIALTAFGQDIGETHGLGGQDVSQLIQEFLEKPVEPNVLLERVATALQGPGNR